MYQSSNSKRNNQFSALIDNISNTTGDMRCVELMYAIKIFKTVSFSRVQHCVTSSDDEKQIVSANSAKNRKSPKGGSVGTSGAAGGASVHPIFDHFKQTQNNSASSPHPHSSSSSLQHPHPDNNNAVTSVPKQISTKPPPIGDGENPLETPYATCFINDFCLSLVMIFFVIFLI